MTDQKDPLVVCIVQARMGSSRLPGKVMEDICGHPMLWWVATRAQMANLVNCVVVATSTNTADDEIETFCSSHGIDFFRGSEFDVLDRIYRAAITNEADIVVRLTADCPLVDPQLVDETIKTLVTHDLDFCANRLPPPYKRTYPIGLDVETARMSALSKAWMNARNKYEREHVMPYLYDPGNLFKTKILNCDPDYGNYRWTVDTSQDLLFIRSVLSRLDCQVNFNWRDVLKVIEENPELIKINAEVKHKRVDDIDKRAQGV